MGLGDFHEHLARTEQEATGRRRNHASATRATMSTARMIGKAAMMSRPSFTDAFLRWCKTQGHKTNRAGLSPTGHRASVSFSCLSEAPHILQEISH